MSDGERCDRDEARLILPLMESQAEKPQRRRRHDRQSGQAVLMGVLAILLLMVSIAAGLNYLGPKATLNRQQAAVKGSTEVVKKALLAFVARNYRLPCPANGQTNTGLEAPVGGGTCTYASNFGVVPWQTLGLQKTDALDGWGRLIGYAVSSDLTSTGSPFATPAESSNDLIQVSVNGVTSATKYAYLLISYGADGAGGWLQSGTQVSTASIAAAREFANTLSTAYAGTTPFVVWPSNTQTGNASYYDDTLIFETSSQICTELNGAQAGAENSPYCTTSKTNNNNNECGSGTGGCNPLNQPANSGFGSFSATASSGGNTGNATTGANISTPAGASSPVLYMGNVTGSGSGSSLANNSQACVWLNAPLNWSTGTLRAYFEFATSYQGPLGDGFTMTMLPAATSLASGTPCGATPNSNLIEGSYLGFEGIADGTQATATASYDGSSKVTGIAVSSSGSGYLFVPPVNLSGGGSGATGTVSAMSVSGATVTDIGFGYKAATGSDPRPTVTVATAASTGCTASCVNASVSVNSMSVTQVDLTNGGSGYELPSVTITPAAGDSGTGATATATVSLGAVGTITVTNAGTGYTEAPSVSIVGNGTGASATATIDGNGHVSGITVVSGGSGYGPTITVLSASDPSAVSATMTASVNSSGEISALEINSVGSKYTHVPVVSVTCSNGCTPATVTVTGMSVTGLSVTSAGSGYVTVPAITMTAPSGCVTCVTATASAGMSIQQIALGGTVTGYSSAPTVTLPPPKILPKMAIEFDTYFYQDDPYYDDYGYIDGATPPPIASYTTQSLTGIRHHPAYENMVVDAVDVLYHDDTYQYSTSTTNSSGYTVSSSCDNPGPGGDSTGPHGGYTVGGDQGGCTYSSATDIVTCGNNGYACSSTSTLLSGQQGTATIYYHPMRVEAQRYCDSTCSSCGNSTVPTDNYVLVRAYLDCTSTALGGASCSDMTKNLLIGNIPGNTASPDIPLPATYASASAVNFCTPDPGTLSPLGVTALDNILFGFTAGAGAVNGSVMIRNISVGTF